METMPKQEEQSLCELKGKSQEEVMEVFGDIALKSEYLEEIWNETGDYETAMKAYEDVNEKDDNNGQSN